MSTYMTGHISSDLLAATMFSRVHVFPGDYVCDTCEEVLTIYEVQDAPNPEDPGCTLELLMRPLPHARNPGAWPRTCPGYLRARTCPGYLRLVSGTTCDRHTIRFYHAHGVWITHGAQDVGLTIRLSPWYTWVEGIKGEAWLEYPVTQTTPGAVRAYCLGPEWFPGGLAPYDTYEVARPDIQGYQARPEVQAVYRALLTEDTPWTLSLAPCQIRLSRDSHREVLQALEPFLPHPKSEKVD